MSYLLPLLWAAASGQAQDQGVLVELSELLLRVSEWILWFVREFRLAAVHLTLALIWAGIAQGKGRSGVIWFGLAALLPVLSWVFLLLLPPKR